MPNERGGFLRIVGIGASAGGLDALTRLLPMLKPGVNAVYIIAQHMAKDKHVDLVLRLLQHHSSLPLVEAANNDLLVADKVFLIPPGVSGVVQHRRLQLLPISCEQISSPSINALFNSIARETHKQGVGIILSGVGSDGLSGCKAIKAYGGKVIVQSLESAQFDGMPGAVIGAKLADQVLAPEEIPQALDNNSNAEKPASTKPEVLLPVGDAEMFKQLLQRLREVTGSDFSNYKEETLLRRLNRRMAMLKIAPLSLYLSYTQKNPDELHKLQHQFLISLSSFFRDKESFVVLKQHVNELVNNKIDGHSLHIWVPGCASGEECYSWAILLAEILGERLAGFNLRILGSDLNAQVLTIAEQAVYAQAALCDMPPHFLERYFDAAGAGFKVKPYIRQLCHFQVESVVDSQPLEKIDVISCRNLLIYMKSELQDSLIRKFYDALSPAGLLFLGQSETIGLIGNTLFVPLDHHHRLYRRRKINKAS